MTMIDHDVEPDPKRQSNALIGERVHTIMWRTGRTQTQLAAVLRVDQGSVSNRLRGKTTWSAFEVAAVAAWLQVPVTDLIPAMEVSPPDPHWGEWGGDPDGAPSRTRSWDLRISIPKVLERVPA